jgi:hypothetical protein
LEEKLRVDPNKNPCTTEKNYMRYRNTLAKALAYQYMLKYIYLTLEKKNTELIKSSEYVTLQVEVEKNNELKKRAAAKKGFELNIEQKRMMDETEIKLKILNISRAKREDSMAKIKSYVISSILL